MRLKFKVRRQGEVARFKRLKLFGHPRDSTLISWSQFHRDEQAASTTGASPSSSVMSTYMISASYRGSTYVLSRFLGSSIIRTEPCGGNVAAGS